VGRLLFAIALSPEKAILQETSSIKALFVCNIRTAPKGKVCDEIKEYYANDQLLVSKNREKIRRFIFVKILGVWIFDFNSGDILRPLQKG
jgi:hypothetical protein